jgi:hypothetical protein
MANPSRTVAYALMLIFFAGYVVGGLFAYILLTQILHYHR